MFRITAAWFVFAGLPVVAAAGPTAARRVETWADTRLKVTDGLMLWLDAGRQQAARRAHDRPSLPDRGPVDVLYDSSGASMHLVQRFAASQPRYVTAGDLAVVRFDGKDHCLGLTGQNRTLDGFTLFLVAAPRANPGDYRAFLAVNETGKNDYTTGFTVDMTGEASARFVRLNVEGKGFGGAVNLMRSDHPFGEFHTLEVDGGRDSIRLFVDAVAAGRRGRAAGTLRMDNISLGARFYSNTAEPPCLRGFLDGDVAEVLLFDRLITDAERRQVSAYLHDKYAGLGHALADSPARDGQPLRSVANPPPVQMFVPGFAVKELPVSLNNINNVRYRADGKLVALGYDGNIYLLSDSDGDGLEDKVELFWENKGQLRAPIGMALTPPGYKLGTGVFVACKGKLSLLLDTKNRGKADKEVVVATGWKELPHGVDALGVALDRDGNIYFGLGTADYTNPYLLDKDGKAHYDLKSERGTILKVSPDFGKREIVCTGIRFSVGLGMNRRGDLFATDQEGATWLANGNPLDELLHIQPGRHYGFPPRHPRHLPGVIDEPSNFDYSPQHQSTCGLCFNDPVNSGPVFGPAFWGADALIPGYSRGKLWRTKLVKTPAGYVAQTQLLACLNMLAVDACVSPKGELVVAAHSGLPDWGSGPEGKGKLFKIIYADRQLAQPVLAWAAGPREVRVAFDRPLDPRHLQDLARHVTIEYGRYVRAGDRFESLRPGYEVVKQQQATPRFNLPVYGAQVTGDRRTLVLATAPHPEAVHYALTLPGLGRAERPDRAPGTLPQLPAVDLGYDLGGVTADWQGKESTTSWRGWLPHPDLAVGRALSEASADHDELWRVLAQPGRLTLRCQLDLWQMLRPAVQPGASLDYTLPAEQVTVLFRSREPFVVRMPAGVKKAADKAGWHKFLVKMSPREGEPVPVEVELTTGAKPPALEVCYFTNEDSRPRALPLGRVLLPWARTRRQPAELLTPREVPELKGGNWAHGRQLFFGDQALCSRCHQLGGQGGRIGPDLSNLAQRDYESVLRDIREPSAAINPDHITYTVELADGRVLAGVVRTEGDLLVVGDHTGAETRVPRGAVESMTPSKLSTMPEGLDRALGPDSLRDLMTFLLTEPLKPAPPEREGAPPPRRRSEVEAVLKAVRPSGGRHRRLHIVLSAGPKDHGPGEHDYPLWQRRWARLLEQADDVRVSKATGWPTPRQLRTADLIVFYSNNPGWSAARAKELDAYLARGGGLVYIHYAVEGHEAVEALADRIGLAWKGGTSRFREGPLELSFVDTRHPITLGFDKIKLVDEAYWKLVGDPKKIHVLASAKEDGVSRPLLWTHEQGKGRVFVSIPGHYAWTFDDPLFRVLILRGMAWAAGEPVDRFHALVFAGARVKEGR
ncbi:MAG TPA: ThuA domain-containing protein [Gemmataceae bacterium]|nr:ThuA domain-containing protein [Gemmataceae bacterium]